MVQFQAFAGDFGMFGKRRSVMKAVPWDKVAEKRKVSCMPAVGRILSEWPIFDSTATVSGKGRYPMTICTGGAGSGT